MLLLSIVIILLLVLKFIIFKDDKVTSENEPMILNFKDRINTLEEFDSGNYYKAGWLQVQGTNIDLPILDSSSFEDVDTISYSYGWRSPRYETGENREVLIGHNIINVSSTPMLSNENLKNFESLMSFSYAGFAKDNLYIKYTKNGKEGIYLIYAIGFYDYYYDDAESMTNKEKIKDYISNVRKNSIYDYDIDVNENDTLLTVKTCTRYFGANEKEQFIIDARKIREDEEIVKYLVEINANYEELIGNVDNS